MRAEPVRDVSMSRPSGQFRGVPPIVFRATNQGAEPHVLAVVRYPEGTTAQQVIQGEIDGVEGITEFLGGNFSLPGQSFEVTLVDLEPGVYFLVCDVTTADG